MAAFPVSVYTAWNTAATDVVDLVTQAGNQSNLILDPDLDSYYTMDAFVVKEPGIVEMEGRSAALQTLMLAGRAARAPIDQRIELAVEKGVVASTVSGLDADLTTAYQNTADAALRAAAVRRTRPMGGRWRDGAVGRRARRDT